MSESDKTLRRSAKRTRCAIYTRKSSEEGLEQAFNSLDAQREACTAFIASQKHEGWTVVPTLYDDGGFSGGTMQRPALVLVPDYAEVTALLCELEEKLLLDVVGVLVLVYEDVAKIAGYGVRCAGVP